MRCGHRAMIFLLADRKGDMATSTRAFEEIMRTSTECPACRKAMTIRHLRYKHRCKVLKGPAEVQQLISQAREAAVNAHQIRMRCAETPGDIH